jgi:HAD superfamily hydrolase (TIGR01509 family)
MAGEIRAVAFDLDGLMFNTEELYEQVGATLVERRGKRISHELLDEMMGRPPRVALQRMIDWYQLADTIDQLQEETDLIFGDILPRQLAPMPGLVELLDALMAADIPKAITTSSRRAFVDRVLEIYDYGAHFRFVIAAEDVVHGKPHPEIYQTAARQFGVAPAELLVLEDSHNGCRAAVAAGTCAVAVPGRHSRHHDFTGSQLVAGGLDDPRLYQLVGLKSGSRLPSGTSTESNV